MTVLGTGNSMSKGPEAERELCVPETERLKCLKASESKEKCCSMGGWGERPGSDGIASYRLWKS